MSEDVDVLYNEAKTRRVRVVCDEVGFDIDSPVNEGDGFEAVVPSRVRFTLGGHATFQDEFDRLDEKGVWYAFPRWLKIFHGLDAVMLYRYEHSMVAYSVSSFLGRAQHADWDSGPCGFMYYVPDGDVAREWWDKKTPEERKETFDSVADSLTDWANGSVYGLIVEERETVTKTYTKADGTTTPPVVDEEWVDTDEGYWGLLGYGYATEEAEGLVEA